MSESAHFARAGERHEVAPLRYWWSAGRHAPARGFTNCARLGDTYESTASTKLLRPASADKPGRRVAFARSNKMSGVISSTVLQPVYTMVLSNSLRITLIALAAPA